MSRKLILPLLILCLGLPLLAQNLGEQSSAGFNNARTYANVDLPLMRPPLRLFETISLTGMTNANSLAVYEKQFLVGQPSPPTYKLLSRQGNSLWSESLFGVNANFRYVPAFSSSVVILGGESTVSVKAVNVSTGTVAWQDMVGDTNGRYPATTDTFAIYAGNDKIVVRTLAGDGFWQQPVTTAAATLAVRDDSLYFLTRSRTLWAVNLMTQNTKWAPLANVAGDGASLIATEKYLFVNDPANGIVAAIDAKNGQTLWTKTGLQGTFATDPALALGYGRLYVFRTNDGNGHAAVSALDANTGEELWSVLEPATGLSCALVADENIYYYQGGQIITRDATTGVLLWNIPKADLRALSAAGRELYVLLKNKIEVYVPTNEMFMAQMANGGGQTTLVMLTNPGPRVAHATVSFFDDSGLPASIPLQTFGTKSSVDVIVPPKGSYAIQSLDQGGAVVVGWVHVVSDELLRGTTSFQYSQQQEIMREAGVADALPIGFANVYVRVGGLFNAGVAMVNPTEQNADVTLRILNNSGIELNSKTITLVAGGHMARFVTELFPTEVGNVFDGTLIIESHVPIVTTAIRTKGGLQISSYPVGQAVR